MEYLRPPRPGGAPDLPLFHLSRADGSPGDFYHPPAFPARPRYPSRRPVHLRHGAPEGEGLTRQGDNRREDRVPKRGDSVIVLLVILILGALIGTVIGEVIATIAPGGTLEKIFSRGINPGLAPPATLDLKVISLSFGFSVKINLSSLLGIGLALLIYRKL